MLNINYAIKQLILDKNKTNIYNRYPIRFLFTPLTDDAENDIFKLYNDYMKKYYADKNKDLIIKNLYDELPFEDGWITKTQLINFIKKILDDNNDYIILGFSELIRFYSREDLSSIIISFMTDIESQNEINKRIYIVCFSLFEQISLELKTNNRNESINPIIQLSEEQLYENFISVYYANSNFDTSLFDNKIKTSSEWLSIYKSKKLNLSSGIVCISDTLVTLYEMAKPDNFVSIEKLDSYFKLLTVMYKVQFKNTYESDFPDNFWELIFKKCKKYNSFEIRKVLLILLNLQEIDAEIFIYKYKNSDDFTAKMLLLYLKEYGENTIHGYEYLLKNIEGSNNTYNNLIKKIYTGFNSNYSLYEYNIRKEYMEYISVDEFSNFSKEYKNSINQNFINYMRMRIFNNEIENISHEDLFKLNIYQVCDNCNINIDYFKKIFNMFYNSFLKNVICCKSIEDKVLVINLLRNSLITLEEAKSVYIDIDKYIGNKKQTLVNSSMHWLSGYIYEYRLSKLYDSPTKELEKIILSTNSDSFLQWYYSDELNYPLELLKKEQYDHLVVLDGVGIEYFDYMLEIIKEHNKFVLYANYSKCFLPSITSIHKNKYEGKYDSWITKFDKDCIHTLYYKDLSQIPLKLETLKGILLDIFNKYSGKKIALIADHGCTALGKIFNYKKKYDFNENEHEGRCMHISANTKINSTEDYCVINNNESDYLISISGYSLGNTPIRESHGGGTIEEVVVPCLIISDNRNDAINTKYTANVLNKINGIERKVSIEIVPELMSNNLLLIEENGCEHEMIFVSTNVWKTKDNLTLIKNQHAILKFADKQINILIESTMGINLEGDGFDD